MTGGGASGVEQMTGGVETIRCLLCKGVVCYSSEDDSRYKDHLNVEHRVYYYVAWIIQKTVEENSKADFCSSPPPFPSNLTITPIITAVNGSTSIKSEAEDEDAESPVITVFPIQHFQENQIVEDEDDLEDFDEDEAAGIKEAEIITIRVEGQRVGGRKMYKCSLCPNIKPWPTIHKAERHRITHIPLAFRKMFQCPQCKERFIREKNVKRHLDSGLCQGPKDHPCTVCGEVYESKFDLQLHEENHEQLLKRHRCHLCGAKFNKMKYLTKHIRSHSSRKPFKCDLCGKSFKSEYYVKTHRAAHLNESYESQGENFEDSVDFEFEEHLQPEIDLIEEDPIAEDSTADQESGSS